MDPGNFAGSSSASFENGILHAFGSLQVTDITFADGRQSCGASLCSSQNTATANAMWSEIAHVSDPTASVLRLSFLVHGAVNGEIAANSTAPCAILDLGVPLRVWGAGLATQEFGKLPQIHSTTSASCVGGSAPMLPTSAAYNNTYWVDVPVVNGLADFTYQLSAGFNASLWSNSPNGTFSAEGVSDFSHTAGVTGYSLFDAAGNDITGVTAVDFQNGMRVMTTVPEPATIWLLAIGVTSMVAAAHQRKRSASK